MGGFTPIFFRKGDMSEKRLIISDFDGTLLDSNGDLPPGMAEYLNTKMDAGHRLTLATGRMLSAAVKPLDGLRLTLPLITLNGCYIGLPEVFHQALDNQLMCDLYEGVAALRASVVLMQRDKAYLKGEKYMPVQSLMNWVANIEFIDTLELTHCSDTTLVLINGQEDVIRNYHIEAEKVVKGRAGVFSYPSTRYPPMWYLEIRPKKANKGIAVQKLIEYLELDEQDVLIIGDYYNDLEMFDHAGLKAAPANAVDEIRQRADYVSPLTNDEGAVKDILERLL